MRVADIYPVMADLLPAQEHGVAKINHFEIDEQDARMHNLRVAINSHRYGRYDTVEPGRYARLAVNGQLVMTDTPMERMTNREFIREAHGRVLIAGLGLGMVLHPVLAKSDVEHVTVLEVEQDVIALIEPTLSAYDDRLAIVHADALSWRPARGQRFDTVYFDIWPTISGDNAREMNVLHRRYGRYLDRSNPRKWLGSWREYDARHMARS